MCCSTGTRREELQRGWHLISSTTCLIKTAISCCVQCRVNRPLLTHRCSVQGVHDVSFCSVFSLKPEDDSCQSGLQPHLLLPLLTCLPPSVPQTPEGKQSPPKQPAPGLRSGRVAPAGSTGGAGGHVRSRGGLRFCRAQAGGQMWWHPRGEDEAGRSRGHGSGPLHLHLRRHAAVREPGPGDPVSGRA